MNYSLQVIKGRSAVNTLRLIDGVNSIGRHDDCLIRIRSSQVSRRHCEVLEEGTTLVVRDLGSSNGTYVNGKRVLGKQALKPGDALTIGGVTLRVDLLREAGAGAGGAAKPAPHDTAEVAALPVGEEDLELELDDEEFEIALDDEQAPQPVDIIPLDDEPPAADKKASETGPDKRTDATRDEPANEPEGASKLPAAADEEDAVAQFLMDLKLDEDD